MPTTAPLRKIVKRTSPLAMGSDWFAYKKVLLECGHEAWCPETTAYRARCKECAKQQYSEGNGNG